MCLVWCDFVLLSVGVDWVVVCVDCVGLLLQCVRDTFCGVCVVFVVV